VTPFTMLSRSLSLPLSPLLVFVTRHRYPLHTVSGKPAPRCGASPPSRGRMPPCSPNDHITPITQSSILIGIHATAHTPGGEGVGLPAVAHAASGEEHEHAEEGTGCVRRRRPIAGCLDPGKDARRDKGRRQRGILHALELHHRRQPPAHRAPNSLIDTIEGCGGPGFARGIRRLLPHEPSVLVQHRAGEGRGKARGGRIVRIPPQRVIPFAAARIQLCQNLVELLNDDGESLRASSRGARAYAAR